MPRLFARPEFWEVLDEVDRALYCVRALQQLHPSWVFVGPTAALVYGLEIPEDRDRIWPLRIGASWGSRGRNTRYVVRQVVEGDDVTVVDHVRVTTIMRTAFDCMREMSFSDGLAIADSALSSSGMTRQQMIDEMNEFRRTSRGGRHAMETANYADAAARDGDESRLRAAIIEQGFQLPQLHVDVVSRDGSPLRASFAWQLEDGMWIAAEQQSWRLDKLPKDDLSVRTILLPPKVTQDTNRLVEMLEAVGVPHASEPPQIGIAKPFTPTFSYPEP